MQTANGGANAQARPNESNGRNKKQWGVVSYFVCLIVCLFSSAYAEEIQLIVLCICSGSEGRSATSVTNAVFLMLLYFFSPQETEQPMCLVYPSPTEAAHEEKKEEANPQIGDAKPETQDEEERETLQETEIKQDEEIVKGEEIKQEEELRQEEVIPQEEETVQEKNEESSPEVLSVACEAQASEIPAATAAKTTAPAAEAKVPVKGPQREARKSDKKARPEEEREVATELHDAVVNESSHVDAEHDKSKAMREAPACCCRCLLHFYLVKQQIHTHMCRYTEVQIH